MLLNKGKSGTLCYKVDSPTGDFNGLPGIKPVFHENERFFRTDRQQLIIKGINPINLSQSIYGPHSTETMWTRERIDFATR